MIKKSCNSVLNINVLSLTHFSPLPFSPSLHPDWCHNPSPKSVTTAMAFSLAEPELWCPFLEPGGGVRPIQNKGT